MRLSSALRAFALLAAAKGALVLLAGFGLLSLVHHDNERFTWSSLGALILNLAVVAFMLYCVFRVNCEKSVSFLGRGRILRMTP
jgi:hypothetical protein